MGPLYCMQSTPSHCLTVTQPVQTPSFGVSLLQVWWMHHICAECTIECVVINGQCIKLGLAVTGREWIFLGIGKGQKTLGLVFHLWWRRRYCSSSFSKCFCLPLLKRAWQRREVQEGRFMTSSEIQPILYSMCVTRGEREAVRLCNVKKTRLRYSLTSYCISGKKVIKSVENVKNPSIQLLSKVCLPLLS